MDVEQRLGDRRRHPEFDDVVFALGRRREADVGLVLGADHEFQRRVNHEVHRRVVDVLGGNLLAPRPAVFVFGHLPDRANALAHVEEVAALECLLGDSEDDRPQLLWRLYFCNEFVVSKAPVILAWVKVPQNPRFLEFCGLHCSISCRSNCSSPLTAVLNNSGSILA